MVINILSRSCKKHYQLLLRAVGTAPRVKNGALLEMDLRNTKAPEK